MAWKLATTNGHDGLKNLDASDDTPVFGNDACAVNTTGKTCTRDKSTGERSVHCKWSRKAWKQCSKKRADTCW